MSDKATKKISNIINALSMHTDPESIKVLEEIGTNSSVDIVREMTARALVRKNSEDALKVVITSEGKGINDLSTLVAMSTINELLGLEDKETAMRVLSETVESELEDEIKDNARSVKALMALS